jgi:peptidoglycan hydrolase-like protein with peptidoglycan-binding domain
MRRGILLVVACAAVFAAGCSGATDADETEAVAAAEPAGPSDGNADEPSDQLDSTSTDTSTNTSADGAGPDEPAENDLVDNPEPDVSDTEDTDDTDDTDSDTDDIEDTDTDTDTDGTEDTDETETEDSGSDADSDAPEPTVLPASERNAPLTGPGSASAASAFTLVPVERGANGDDVRALQARLAELGFAPGTPDGSYGRRTVAAVEAFQGLVGLDVTGDADPETIRALIAYRYDGLVLRAGDEGDEVETLQLLLSEGPFDPGPIDGTYGTGTRQAVWALEKIAGIPIDGDWGPLDDQAWQQLLDGEIGGPEMAHEARWVEVDLSEQVMKVYDPDSSVPVLISHASSGSGIPWENEEHSGSSVTPRGEFTISRRISGWRESSLNIGRLYNPLYFNGGIAFHGATSVPLYPASHGCIRLPMHVAEYLPDELPNGTTVHVLS